MKKLSSCFGGILITIFLLNGNIYATTLSNFGFESGDFSGWDVITTTSGSRALVVNSYTGATGTYSAVHGTYFALLYRDTWQDAKPVFEQTFTIAEGSTISGNAAFDDNEGMDRWPNDAAQVYIDDADGTNIAMPWYMDSATVGHNNQTAWQGWSWTAPSTGTYTVRFRLYDVHIAGSRALFDAPQITNVVPEPATMLLFGAGIACLAGTKIRSKKK